LYNLRGRVLGLIEQPFEKVNKSLLVSLHREVFSSNLCPTCKNEHILAYIELTRFIYPKDNKMNKQNTPPSKGYRMNPKHKTKRIMLKGMGLVTADTLTDAQAKFMLDDESFSGMIMTIKEYKAESEPKKATKKD
tara:strand:- start:310 stop:714 length:405 start_codon:yes stop_codon:yes gene_type:complete